VLDHLGVNGDKETTEDITGCDFAMWQTIIAKIVDDHRDERDDIFVIVYG
jgi:hypothetical protein